MKKFTFLIAALLLTTLNLSAQLPYSLTTQTGQSYQPLTGATSINGSTIWDDDTFSVAIPFTFKIGGIVTPRFNLDLSAGGFLSGTTGTVPGFSYGDMDLADKGSLTNAATLSPIRYTVTGTAPGRIFKAEVANAGFYDEMDSLNTANDSVSIQIWLYETSNVVELRYGPSRISTNAYFYIGNGPAAGYIKALDLDTGDAAAYYTISGNPSAPTIDSLDLINGTGSVLNSYPANGTVYRFTPVTSANGISIVPFKQVKVYPTNASGAVYIDYRELQPAAYDVISADGRTTGISGQLTSGNHSLDISSLAPGIYTIRIANSANHGNYRFLKQ